MNNQNTTKYNSNQHSEVETKALDHFGHQAQHIVQIPKTIEKININKAMTINLEIYQTISNNELTLRKVEVLSFSAVRSNLLCFPSHC